MREAGERLRDRLVREGHDPGPAYDTWLAQQALIGRGVVAALSGRDEVFDGAPVGGRPIRRAFRSSRFDTFVLAVYHGSVNVLEIFEDDPTFGAAAGETGGACAASTV